MTLEPQYYTATMASLYASQGYLEKAAEVYRHLLERTPDRPELAAALSDVVARMARETDRGAEGEGIRSENSAAGEKDIKTLLNEWVFLILEAKKISVLKRNKRTGQN